MIENGASDADVTVDAQAGGLFDVTLHRVVLDETLPQETVFKCVLSIPDTQYQISRKGIYFPGKSSFLFYILFILLGWKLSHVAFRNVG